MAYKPSSFMVRRVTMPVAKCVVHRAFPMQRQTMHVMQKQRLARDAEMKRGISTMTIHARNSETNRSLDSALHKARVHREWIDSNWKLWAAAAVWGTGFGLCLAVLEDTFKTKQKEVDAIQEDKKGVGQAVSTLRQLFIGERRAREALTHGQFSVCTNWLQFSRRAIEELRENSMFWYTEDPVLLDAYRAFSEEWAKDQGGSPFQLNATKDFRFLIALLESQLRHHEMCLSQQQVPRMLKEELIDTHNSTYAMARHYFEKLPIENRRAWQKRWRSSSLFSSPLSFLAASLDPVCFQRDLFALKGLHDEATQEQETGTEEDWRVVEKYMCIANIADDLTGSFHVTDPQVIDSISTSVALFLDLVRPQRSADEECSPLLAGIQHNLHPLRNVGRRSLFDALFLPSQESTPSKQDSKSVLNDLHRSALTWRHGITARTRALWVIFTSFNVDQLNAVADVVRLLHALGEPMKTSREQFTPAPLQRLHKVYTTLDHTWLTKKGGAGHILVSMAAGLEVILRNDCVHPDVRHKVHEEALRCIKLFQEALHAHGDSARDRSQLQAQALLVDAMLKHNHADAFKAMRLFRECDVPAQTSRNTSWASFVGNVLGSIPQEDVDVTTPFEESNVSRCTSWWLDYRMHKCCKRFVSENAQKEHTPTSFPKTLRGKTLSWKESEELVLSVARVRLALQSAVIIADEDLSV